MDVQQCSTRQCVGYIHAVLVSYEETDVCSAVFYKTVYAKHMS